jgi:hypothetical protein
MLTLILLLLGMEELEYNQYILALIQVKIKQIGIEIFQNKMFHKMGKKQVLYWERNMKKTINSGLSVKMRLQYRAKLRQKLILLIVQKDLSHDFSYCSISN